MEEAINLLLAGGKAGVSAINPASAVLAGIPELVKLGTGIGQRIAANRIGKRTQRPVYEIPEAAQLALANQQNLAMGRAPGLSTAQNQLARNQAGATAAIQGSGGGAAETMAALMGLDQNAATQALDLGGMQQNWTASQMQNLINGQDRFANWQQEKWKYNVDEPYRNAMEKMAQLRNTGNENMDEAGRALAGVGAAAIGYKKDSPAGSGVAGSPGSKVAEPVFNPDAGGDPSYDFDQIEADAAKKGVAFDPNAQKTPEYDFSALQEEYDKRGVEFNPNQGMETYDFEELSKPPFPKGPYPLGYDPKTMKITPVAGPPNYNPQAAAPQGPYPRNYSNPGRYDKLLGIVGSMLGRGY